MIESQSFPTDTDASLMGLCIRHLSSDQLEIISHVKLHWVKFDGTSQHIPSALVYREVHWELMDAQENEQGWVYCCAPWPSDRLVRNRIYLDAEHWNIDQQEIARKKAYEARSEHVWMIEFLLGILPAEIQIKLHDHVFRFSTKRASRLNALCTGVAGMFLIDGMLGLSLSNLVPMGLFCIDSFVRIHQVMNEREACGFLPFEFVYFIFKTFILKPLIRR